MLSAIYGGSLPPEQNNANWGYRGRLSYWHADNGGGSHASAAGGYGFLNEGGIWILGGVDDNPRGMAVWRYNSEGLANGFPRFYAYDESGPLLAYGRAIIADGVGGALVAGIYSKTTGIGLMLWRYMADGGLVAGFPKQVSHQPPHPSRAIQWNWVMPTRRGLVSDNEGGVWIVGSRLQDVPNDGDAEQIIHLWHYVCAD